MPAELDDIFDLILVVGSATVNESETESRKRSKQDARLTKVAGGGFRSLYKSCRGARDQWNEYAEL
jgi:hypothetical protein